MNVGAPADGMDDILCVGRLKPMGYLPIKTLVDRCDDGEWLENILQEKNLKWYISWYGYASAFNFYGTLFVYDPVELQKCINRFSAILNKYGWPLDYLQFVKRTATDYIRPHENRELFYVIAIAFGDKRFISREE